MAERLEEHLGLGLLGKQLDLARETNTLLPRNTRNTGCNYISDPQQTTTIETWRKILALCCKR